METDREEGKKKKVMMMMMMMIDYTHIYDDVALFKDQDSC